MGNIDKIKSTIKGWRLGDYFRQFSIVAAGIIVTFWGSDKLTAHARQKEVQSVMQLVADELKSNRKSLMGVKSLLDIDIHMSALLIEHRVDISTIPSDTLVKYKKFFSNMSTFDYSTDALDVLKGSSLMQYIPDKRLLQSILQTYHKMGKLQKNVTEYYQMKNDAVMTHLSSIKKEHGEKHSRVKRYELLLNFIKKRNFEENILSLLNNDTFVNYTALVPNFLDWEEFSDLEQVLGEQIRIIEAKYK